MREENDAKVRTQEGGEWEYTKCLPESIDEAVEVYGGDGALELLNSGLVVKQQNVAREAFKAGKEQYEVNELVKSYRPGGGSRVSMANQSMQLILEHKDRMESDPDLQSKVKAAFVKNRHKEVVDLLGGTAE